jgi:hypothetical protein
MSAAITNFNLVHQKANGNVWVDYLVLIDQRSWVFHMPRQRRDMVASQAAEMLYRFTKKQLNRLQIILFSRSRYPVRDCALTLHSGILVTDLYWQQQEMMDVSEFGRTEKPSFDLSLFLIFNLDKSRHGFVSTAQLHYCRCTCILDLCAISGCYNASSTAFAYMMV